MNRSTVIAAALLLSAGCGAAGGPRVPQTVANLALPAEQEAQLAEQVDRELHQQLNVLEDPEIVEYVRRVGNRVAEPSAQERGALNVHFEVIDDPTQMNAFAAPGGNIYIYSGMLLAADSEAELASVLAHEVAHVANRDVARAVVAQYGLQTIAQAALGNDPNVIAGIATQLVGAGALASHSRGQEAAADEAGLRYLAAAGYDPSAMGTMFEEFARLRETQPGTVETFFASHPPPQDRIRLLEQQVADMGAPGGETGQGEFARIEQALRQRYGDRGDVIG